MEQRKQLPPGKGSIYLNLNPKNPHSPRYSGKLRMLDGTLTKVSVWLNGEIGKEGFNFGIAMEEVDEGAEAQRQEQRQQQAGWNKVQATLQEGQPPQQAAPQQQTVTEEDDVPF